jgi:hypothetical protein
MAAAAPDTPTMTRPAQLLLLLLALATLAATAHALTGLPWPTVLALLVGGVVAQGFATWQPPPPAVYGLTPPSAPARVAGWLVRAVVGCIALGALLAVGLWALDPRGATLDQALALTRQWLTSSL